MNLLKYLSEDALRLEERRLRVSENRALRRIFGPKDGRMEEVARIHTGLFINKEPRAACETLVASLCLRSVVVC
jgi:hypothetical protein